MSSQNSKQSKTDKTDKNRGAKESIINSLASGLSVTESCEKAKISRDTYYRWLYEDESFKKNIETSKQSRIGAVEDALYDTALDGNVQAGIFFLCNRDPDRWQHLYKIQASGNLGINTNMSDEDRKTLKEIGDAFTKSKVSN